MHKTIATLRGELVIPLSGFGLDIVLSLMPSAHGGFLGTTMGEKV